jgi:hypothetical protein
MRTRAAVLILTAGLAAIAAGGCQILAGLTVLQAGTGGAGGGPTQAMCGGKLCDPDQLCGMMGMMCVPCDMPPQMPSMCTVGGLCTACLTDGTCVVDCTKMNCPLVMNLPPMPVQVECGGQCNPGAQNNNTQIACNGPFPCTVHCGVGGCAMMQMQCSKDGPCKLRCDAMGCNMANLTCGDNDCDVTNFKPPSAPAPPVHQLCKSHFCPCTQENL